MNSGGNKSLSYSRRVRQKVSMYTKTRRADVTSRRLELHANKTY